MGGLTVHEPVLVNTIGHAAGAVVFALFLRLLAGDPAGARLGSGRLAAAAVWLALIWNISSLAAIGLRDARAPAVDTVVGIGTAALSLLPAVLLHVSLGGTHGRLYRAGYLASAVAIGIHWSEFLLGAPEFHNHALRFTAMSFGALTVVVAVALLRSREGGPGQQMRRLLGTVALFLFALSFVHFGFGREPHAWPVEALLHHAGIPLALFVLLQDFRFVLLDALLRVLVNLAAASAAILAGVWLLGAVGVDFGAVSSPFLRGLLFVGASLALVVFAAGRDRIQQWLTRGVFQRPDLERALSDLRTHPENAGDQEYREWAAARLSRFFEARIQAAGPELAARLDGAGLHAPVLLAGLAECRELPEAREFEVAVPLRAPGGGGRYYLLGRRPGGRPYLSEDLAAAARLAEQISEHVTHYRDLEMKRLVAAAELRALQAQIHPHFLFNALNTLYGVIPREAAVARRVVLNLADIWRYFLRTDRTYIPLAEELEIVEAYLEVEKLRLGARLRTMIEADAAARNARVPVLCVQPLTENAVRHGVARSPEGGLVRVTARLDGDRLRVAVSDTGPGFSGGDRRDAPPGVGLENVERRLRLCYGDEYGLEVESRPGATTVRFQVPVRVAEEVRQ